MAHSPPNSSAPPEGRSRLAWMLATCGGIGWLRPGPGTYASIAATLVWFALAWVARPFTQPQIAELFGIVLALAAAATFAGIPAASRVARECGADDPGFVVIDELAGQWIALLAACIPLAGWPLSASGAIVSLLLFRAFDIWKPWPVSALERLPGGAGIMLDDVAAGVYAFAITLGLRALHLIR